MRILFIGDIVGKPGRDTVKKVLPQLKRENKIDFVIANAENLAHGRGATLDTIKEMQSYGVDYFTGGDHLMWFSEFEDEIEKLPVVRPANYPDPYPDQGYALVQHKNGKKILIINLLGRTNFGGAATFLDDPFRKTEEILDKFPNEDINYTIIDFHAEATSEKAALGYYLDGKVSAVLGTHTHVPTCDTRVLPKGTLFVSDVGMTGNIYSVLGVKKEIIIDLFLTARNQKFEWEEAGNTAFRSVILDLTENSISRFDKDI
jgi:metallophosphoesterase (TIGR00282 family)